MRVLVHIEHNKELMNTFIDVNKVARIGAYNDRVAFRLQKIDNTAHK